MPSVEEAQANIEKARADKWEAVDYFLPERPRRVKEQPQVFGRFEMAELLDVDSRTPHAWSHRGLLPPPDHTVNNGPAWNRATLIYWAWETGRLPESLASEGAKYGPMRKIRGRMKKS